MTLKEILDGIEYTVSSEDDNTQISGVVYDSRKVTAGCLFVCLKGYASDGHDFAVAAVRQGAAAVLVSDPVSCPGAVIAVVKDTRHALALLSCNFFNNPAEKLITVGVTGTKGKTTVTAMIRSILEKAGIKTGTIGTLGVLIEDKVIKTENTTPESYEIQKSLDEMVKKGCGAVVIEASSLGLKWHRTGGLLFDIGVFTNFSPDHVGAAEHEDLDEYLKCKSLLFKTCKKGIVNIDDAACRDIISGHICDIATFGITGEAQLKGYDGKLVSNDGYLGVRFQTRGAASLDICVPIPGKFSIYNALAAASVCLSLNISEEAIIEGLRDVKVKGRVEPVYTGRDFTLLIDYAHNALSMESVLKTLRDYNPPRIITMFGAGGNRPKCRRYEMGEVSGRLSDLTVITEDNSRDEDVKDIIADIVTGVEKNGGKYVIVEDRREAIKYCLNTAQSGDVVLLAGKGHEDYQLKKGVKTHFDEREVIEEILMDKR